MSAQPHLRPTGRVRWRALNDEEDQRQRSILEVLWVSDCRTQGEWLPAERVALGAPSEASEADLRQLP